MMLCNFCERLFEEPLIETIFGDDLCTECFKFIAEAEGLSEDQLLCYPERDQAEQQYQMLEDAIHDEAWGIRGH